MLSVPSESSTRTHSESLITEDPNPNMAAPPPRVGPFLTVKCARVLATKFVRDGAFPREKGRRRVVDKKTVFWQCQWPSGCGTYPGRHAAQIALST